MAACLPHPDPPPPPYHAVGSQQAWHLIIDDKHVTFIPPGGDPIRQIRPQPIIGIAGEIYQTQRIHANIVHAQCVIGNRTYPDKVQVSVDGVQHEGCGGL